MLIVLLLLATSILPAGAQNRDDRDHRDNRSNQAFYSGVRSGGRGGEYSDPHRDNGRYNDDNRRYNNDQYHNGRYNNRDRDQGGIGPGKGALIGGASGAVLGALFGHGLKGAVVGGAAGAGIGAIVGEAHQNDDRR
ncbi:MAG TPA: YMGG-like glycine zipper-containing protein [Candidatus Angelobacter sp.]|nr:YMGG-like glycine zipper-containing protein [Candidatus Angelobacter sp.]